VDPALITALASLAAAGAAAWNSYRATRRKKRPADDFATGTQAQTNIIKDLRTELTYRQEQIVALRETEERLHTQVAELRRDVERLEGTVDELRGKLSRAGIK
jgi:predicted RNase H-like nuclease (RuvC/YqgF family)